tara:strand:- start:13 stop:477 length:465 start_codon:yes stop_codon:yes gene_type:complete
MSETKYRLEPNSTFDGDKVSDYQKLQKDIEDILDETLSGDNGPDVYVSNLRDYFKDRPHVVDGVLESMLKEGSDVPSLDDFVHHIALLHLHARQSYINMKQQQGDDDKEGTIKVPAPSPTGYVIYDTVEQQQKALEEVKTREDMKDIFPDIARA